MTVRLPDQRAPFSPFPGTPRAATQPAPDSTIGAPGRPVRALAFSGGMFDTAMQLGVAHAILVSRAEPPDVVVGVAAGAINAVALADILQAGGTAKPAEKLAAQAARFRLILEAYRNAPGEIATAIMPDIYQIDAQAPLKPVRLPIHTDDERNFRRFAAHSRAGLVRLANHLLALDVSVRAITRITRALLGLRGEPELRKWYQRLICRLAELSLLGRTLVANLGSLAPVAWRIMRIAVTKTADREARFRTPVGKTAGGILARSVLARRMIGAFQWSVGFFALLLLTVPAIAIALLWGFAPLVTAPLASLRGALLRRPGNTDPLMTRRTKGGLLGRVRRFLARDLLATYGIADALFDAHALRTIFVRLFDPDYYGRREMDEIVDAAFTDADPSPIHPLARDESGIAANIGEPPLSRRSQPRTGPRHEKALRDYAKREPSIRVGVIAANVASGQLNVLDEGVPVVQALVAATAFPPLFEAQKCSGQWYISGAKVSNEPTRALLHFLRHNVHADASAVHVYPVTSLPLSRQELDPDPKEYSGLVTSSLRALRLERFRDATLDRRLTDVLTKTLPDGKAVWWPDRAKGAKRPASDTEGHVFLRAHTFPIELDSDGSVNERIAVAESDDERRRLIVESVADGCRATLETMLGPLLDQVPQAADYNKDEPEVTACREFLEKRLRGQPLIPGSKENSGPGLPEVCAACALRLRPKGAEGDRRKVKEAHPDPRFQRVLTVRRPARSLDDAPLSVWPRQGEREEPGSDEQRGSARQPAAAPPRERAAVFPEWQWPKARASIAGSPAVIPGEQRPTISLLFSGGVFRGVYQAGVLSALADAGVQPDVIAGSSVGSIIAAMAARVFASDDPEEVRRARIARVAATFLAVDRLVLTDRFADFIRGFTLRAGETNASIRQLDESLRSFDRRGTAAFGHDFRRVLAGFERLLYISPFELKELVASVRLRQYNRTFKLLRDFAQEWLERGAVGAEILGAEPLELLIREQVVGELVGDSFDPASPLVDKFKQAGLQFISTATNLSRGKLETLYLPGTSTAEGHARLLDALLASSAFPAVFRPRWTWEVTPGASAVEQLIDGGVMDNLPLDAVARFLDLATRARKLAPRPVTPQGKSVPHLLFTASLEVERQCLGEDVVEGTARNWVECLQRSRELKYNNKIDNYANLQKALRMVYQERRGNGERSTYTPLDLEVISVKPKWLCGTFAFHPMLGFRRHLQAASIAHGCKTTLKRLHEIRSHREQKTWADAWGLRADRLDTWSDTPEAPEKAGGCWYRAGCDCPFSKQALASSGLKAATCQELEQIYRLCKKPSTHAAAG